MPPASAAAPPPAPRRPSCAGCRRRCGGCSPSGTGTTTPSRGLLDDVDDALSGAPTPTGRRGGPPCGPPQPGRRRAGRGRGVRRRLPRGAAPCLPSAWTALTLAYLAHVEVTADRVDAAMLMAVDASLLTEEPAAQDPSRPLLQAHRWLSLTLAGLDLEELAVAHAGRAHAVAAVLPDVDDQWQTLLLSAQRHVELAQTLHRRGDEERARELAEEAIGCATAARELDREPAPAEADLLDVVQAWALTCADDLDGALGPLRRVHRHVQADGDVWLRGYTDLVLGRLLARLAPRDGDVVRGEEAVQLLVDAAGAFAASGDRRRYRQCLLELGQNTADLGPPRRGPALAEGLPLRHRARARPRPRAVGGDVRAPQPAARGRAAGRRPPPARPRGPAHRPGQPAQRRAPAGRAARSATSRCRWPWWTSTGSRRSTTAPRTRRATSSCAGWPTCCASTAAPTTRSTAGPATSSSCCCPTATEAQAVVVMERLRAAVAAADWSDLRLHRAGHRERGRGDGARGRRGPPRAGGRGGARCSTPPTCCCSPRSAAGATGCAPPAAEPAAGGPERDRGARSGTDGARRTGDGEFRRTCSTATGVPCTVRSCHPEPCTSG